MPAYTTVATCALAQWALDFTGNLARIKESIRIAKQNKAKYRLGPELEVCGYGCEDHFFEADTVLHSWESIREILRDNELTHNIVCDIGMPVTHENVRYNCRVLCLNGKILLIRPKSSLADDGSYREGRWFTGWTKGYKLVDFYLPKMIREVTGQTTVKFGMGAVRFADTMLGCETCEELFTPDNPAITLGLAGCEIIGNGSGSHHTMGRLSRRIELIEETTRKNGGLYLYANSQGCDGGRLYFDGAAIIVMNGVVLAQGTQFSMRDVEVLTASVDLTDVGNFRTAIASRGVQADKSDPVPHVSVDWYFCEDTDLMTSHPLTASQTLQVNTPEEEIGFGPACWMWDYLRRSRGRGFFVPLTGGPDSAATASIVSILCQMLFKTTTEDLSNAGVNTLYKSCKGIGGDKIHESDLLRSYIIGQLRKICRDPAFVPTSPKHIASKIFYTCFMRTKNSSPVLEKRAKALAEEIGANFSVIDMESTIDAALEACAHVGPTQDTSIKSEREKSPRDSTSTSAAADDAAALEELMSSTRQHVQARCRMVFSYLCAQLAPWKLDPQGWYDNSSTAGTPTLGCPRTPSEVYSHSSSANLLVLGSANLDESLCGYFTKYDSSSADINPIGALSRTMVKSFLRWAGKERGMPTLLEIVAADDALTCASAASVSSSTCGSPAQVGMKVETSFGGTPLETCLERDQLVEQAGKKMDDPHWMGAVMGLTNEDFNTVARLRLQARCGPFSMFRKLLMIWDEKYSCDQIATKVKNFFKIYATNRHKMSTLTPTYHLENHSCDDNRYDMRQFLYDPSWDWQFKAIDRQLQQERERKRQRHQ